MGEAGKPTLTRSLFYLAWQMTNRDRALAQRMFDESLVLARETGDTWVIGWTLYFQGNLAIRQGDYALARTFYSNSLVQFQKDGNQVSAAGSIKALGWVLYRLEDYSAARSRFEEVVPIYREFGDKFSMAQTLEGLGYVAYQQGAYQQATLFFEESLALFRESNRERTRSRGCWVISESLPDSRAIMRSAAALLNGSAAADSRSRRSIPQRHVPDRAGRYSVATDARRAVAGRRPNRVRGER